jgi:two-component system LytT family response regulator
MISVLIADDEAPARSKLQRWLSEQPEIDIIGEAADGLQAAALIESHSPQIVFLDIQMPGMSGLEVAAQLEPDLAPLIVFITAYDEHAIKAFELNAVDYLLKPYDKDRLLRTVQRLRTQLITSNSKSVAVHTARAQSGCCERLLVPDGDHLQLINVKDINWLESDDNYVHVHTRDRQYMLRRTLRDLLDQLGERFLRVHKSCAVNLAEVMTLEPLFKGDYELLLRTGQRLRLSRRYKELVFERLQQ